MLKKKRKKINRKKFKRKVKKKG